jgi:hypothetical protein
MNTAVAVNTSNTIPQALPAFRDIPLNRIQESDTNPRRSFDETKLAELGGQHPPAWRPPARPRPSFAGPRGRFF